MLVLFGAYLASLIEPMEAQLSQAQASVQGLGLRVKGAGFGERASGLSVLGVEGLVWLGFMAPYPAKAVCALSCTCSEITEIAASRGH